MSNPVPHSKKSLRLLLVAPKGRKDSKSNQKPLFNMALGVLVSLTPEHHHIEIIDEHFGDTVDYSQKYDVVGITSRTIDAKRSYEIADEFRKRGQKVILGGLHVSFNAEEAAPHADTLVCGEAENLWQTILDDVASNTLKASYNSKDFPQVQEIVPLDYERIAKASKRTKVDGTKSIPIYITRGCPFECSFCVTPNFTGKLYRAQKPEDLIKQIETAKRVFFKAKGKSSKPWFMLCDENLGVSKKRLWETLDLIKECNINFSVFFSINFLEDKETVRKLVAAGCIMVLVGFESIKQSTLEAYNKGHVNSADQFARLIEECRQAGLNVQGNFLVNPDLDSYEDMDDLVKFVSKNNVFMPIFQIITPYPGTSMYWEYKNKGLITDEDWDRYNAMNLVIRSDKYDPVEFQHKFMTSYYKAYTWKNIANRVRRNPYKLLNLITSLAFRKNLREQLDTFEELHHIKDKR
ncbi:B12-binding domain-containing radical SAM protein [Chlorobium sp. BLA1]|uniref:B12-binding domain-containing radical SAM protein n=1 Tax=Candidatus Chlorobium masyuteum TaxID=2716876 RepID=UPI0014223A2B|nr:radical SAM protein [Candidatus Chlorobium masyuteum]NHQ60971.1 B12-binding domain-containing radical SAM protein [Candidatus Chlorobium masyuteum]NTU45529.1 B12-binding domain-containing radical SAM protein [Chlorobiaceae bacterium]